MALNGSLKDFPLADIFQLIGQQQKSGSLFVKNSQTHIRLIFFKGQLVLGNAKGHDRLLLGQILQKSGLVQQEDLQHVLEEQKASKRSLGDLLLRKKLISPAQFKQFIRLQLDEILFELFQWKEGVFEFTAEKLNIKTEFFDVQRPEGALMEQFRRQDEWPGVLSYIQSLDTSFEQKDLENTPPDFENISHPHAEKVFSLLTEAQTVEDLAFMSQLGTFETGAALSKLLQAELIQPCSTKQNIIVQEINLLPRSLIFVFFFMFFVFALFFHPQSHFFLKYFPHAQPGKMFRSERTPINDLKHDFSQKRIRNHIETYFLEYGRYPLNLAELPVSNDIKKQWLYVRTKSNYQIYRKGL